MELSGTYLHVHYSDGPFFRPKDAIHHNLDISGTWRMFILDKSEGFTQGGVERLNNSIRTYVWAILGAQVQTRSNILKGGTGFDAQKQFLANIEDAIASPVDIPSSISRYQKTLQYASTPLDFFFGIGLYLAPSDMALNPGNVQGYNNEIVIAGSEAAVGHNTGINESEQIGKTAGDVLQRKNHSTSQDWSQGATEWQTRSRCCWPCGSCWPCCWPAGSRTSATTPIWLRGCDKPRRRKNGSQRRRGRGWPSGALVGVSLASPLWPWREAPPRRWPRPTHCQRAVAAFPNVLRSQETIEPMMPGRAAVALPAKLARAHPRCFFIHSLTPWLRWLGSRRWGAPHSSASESKDKSAYRHADCCKDARDRYPLFVEESSNSLSQLLVFMEESPDGLTNSVDLGQESCSVRGEGFEPRLPFKLDVGELTFKLLH